MCASNCVFHMVHLNVCTQKCACLLLIHLIPSTGASMVHHDLQEKTWNNVGNVLRTDRDIIW